jgi:DNA-binding CsgD family transcriptional regulator
MNSSKKSRFNHGLATGFSVHPKAFVFFDKETGTPRFQVNAALDGSTPTDQAASLLALQCVARQQKPNEFSVMITVGENLVDGLVGRATTLIHTCSASPPASPLTRRQQKMLEEVTNGLTNKEIGAKLNLSERTVKFHVSTLLVKFEVQCRMSLILKVSGLTGSRSYSAGNATSRMAANRERGLAPMLKNSRAILPLVVPLEARSGR